MIGTTANSVEGVIAAVSVVVVVGAVASVAVGCDAVLAGADGAMLLWLLRLTLLVLLLRL